MSPDVCPRLFIVGTNSRTNLCILRVTKECGPRVVAEEGFELHLLSEVPHLKVLQNQLLVC